MKQRMDEMQLFAEDGEDGEEGLFGQGFGCFLWACMETNFV